MKSSAVLNRQHYVKCYRPCQQKWQISSRMTNGHPSNKFVDDVAGLLSFNLLKAAP